MRTSIIIAVSLLTAAITASPINAASPTLGNFSKAEPGTSLPDSWGRWLPSTPGMLTRWKLVHDDGGTILRAISNGGSGGVVHRVGTDLEATPMLTWRWRALEHPSGADLATSGRDDAAARVCALFGSSPDSATPPAAITSLPSLTGEPAAASGLCYAWVGSSRAGSVLSLTGEDQVRNLVLATGSKRGWYEESRDLAADFQRVFGMAPGPLVAIGLLTDSDGTGASASAYFGDVRLEAR